MLVPLVPSFLKSMLNYFVVDCPENCHTCDSVGSERKCRNSGCESGFAINTIEGTCHGKNGIRQISWRKRYDKLNLIQFCSITI